VTYASSALTSPSIFVLVTSPLTTAPFSPAIYASTFPVTFAPTSPMTFPAVLFQKCDISLSFSANLFSSYNCSCLLTISVLLLITSFHFLARSRGTLIVSLTRFL
jgi:hypothetical protein